MQNEKSSYFISILPMTVKIREKKEGGAIFVTKEGLVDFRINNSVNLEEIFI